MDYTIEQHEIFNFVENDEGHGIIDAVAGAGKTTTIMECAKYVPNQSEVLFCAFNKSISSEIASKFLERGMNQVTTKTLHALGYLILKDNNSTGRDIVLKNNKYNELLKKNEVKNSLLPHIKKVIQYHGYEFDDYTEKQSYQVENIIREFRRRLLEINAKFRLTLCKDGFQDFKAMIIHYGIFNEIEVEKRYFDNELESYLECNRLIINEANSLSKKLMIIDYSDMLYLPYVWKQYPTRKYSFVFIDECQDLSFSQLGVALKFAKKGSRILSVGDPRQSIYGFTGADIHSFKNIEKYTNAKRLPLTLCFRCPQAVIKIALEIRKDIVGSKKHDGIVKEILFEEVTKNALPNDLIICRTKAPLLFLIFDFIEMEKKIKIHPDIARDIIDSLRGLFKKEELFKSIEYEFRGFEYLKEEIHSRQTWIINKESSRIIDSDMRRLHITSENELLERKLEFLHKRYLKWKKECETVEDIFKKLYEYINEQINPITISTIHSAKGLEAKRVFIINYTDLPLKRSEQKDWEITQEINLKYVAVTRAEEQLFLVHSEKGEKLKDEGTLFDEIF